MVIQSKFKDYYDFVATRYGGGDPRIVYSRGRIKEWHIEARCPMTSPKRYVRSYYTHQDPQTDYMYLVVTGRAYLLSRPSTIEPLDVNKFRITDPIDERLPRWRMPRTEFVFGQEYDFLVDLCRKLQAPVFVISSIEHKSSDSSDVIVCEQCPILGNIGMASRVDPFQMYQDIAVFVGNRMTKTPDMQPPVELSNTQKILKAGFDLRRSFRH